MQYRKDRYGNEISALGLGCMRLPMKFDKIHLEEAEKVIMAACQSGVNYFDTAYIYPGSEAALGEILARNGIRDKVYIATKRPHCLIRSREALDKLFDEELRRLQTDHVDYYLMHMLTDTQTWERLKGLELWSGWNKRNKAERSVRSGFPIMGIQRLFAA